MFILSILYNLAHASLPPHFGHHALQMTTYILNKKLALQSRTKILYQKDLRCSHFRLRLGVWRGEEGL